MLTLKPLRITIIGLGLFAAMVSAQAQLTMTFEEDVAKGEVKVTFSGQASAQRPLMQWDTVSSSSASLTATEISVTNIGSYVSRTNYQVIGTPLFWTGAIPGSAESFNGTGGLRIDGGIVKLYSASTAPNSIFWNGTAVFSGTLAQAGIAADSSGILTLLGDMNIFVVSWNSTLIPAVPEPATYAAVLGLGVAGVALLLRRRAARR